MTNSFVYNLAALQFELSTKCNALCPSCIRTDKLSLTSPNAAIPKNKEMPPETFRAALKSNWSQGLKKIEFCGTMDEPLMHSQFLDLLDIIAEETPQVSVQLHTNGGFRNPDYFTRLAKKMQGFGPQSTVKFSIDGTEKTNKIYRYGVDYSKVINNLKAYISAGGHATWQMLVFPWNSHEVNEVKALAQALGCQQFWLRPDRSQATQLGAEKIEAIRKSKSAPRSELSTGDNLFLDFVEKHMDRPVHCAYRDERQMIFISWDGHVWPCCFWTHPRYENVTKKKKFQETVFDVYGEQFNNLHEKSMDEILSHPLFQNDLVNSWKTGSSLKWRCVEKCSVDKIRPSDGKTDDKSHIKHVDLNQT